MVSSSSNDDIDPEIEKKLTGLHVLAWGDSKLVEDAMLNSIRYFRPTWWKFWVTEWEFDWEAAAKYIDQRTKELETVRPSDLNNR